MNVYREFNTLQEARDYRHAHGTGGWIFEDETTKRATIFPPHMTPSEIFRHPLCRQHRGGNLIGHG